jgi:hypothetical protein
MGDELAKAVKPRSRKRPAAPRPETPSPSVTNDAVRKPGGNALDAIERAAPASLVTAGADLPPKPSKSQRTAADDHAGPDPVAQEREKSEARRAPPRRRRATGPRLTRDAAARHVRADDHVTAQVRGNSRRRYAWREGAGRTPTRHAGPRPEAKPKDLPLPAVKGPLPCEADIKDWLTWDIAAGDSHKAFERVRRLAMIFRPLVSPYREALKGRLRADARTDELAHLFHTRLSTPTRRELLALLDGPPRPLALIDPASMPSFVDTLKPESICVYPEPVFDPEPIRVGEEPPLVIDSMELPAATAAITLGSTLSPLGEVPIVWSIRSPTGQELVRTQVSWKSGSPKSEPLRVAFDTTGTYAATVSIVDSEGLLLTSVSRGITVVESELDHLRALSNDELKWKWSELRDAMFKGALPAGLDRVELQLKLSEVEWVASERKLDVREHADQDVSVIKPTTRALITLDDGLVLAGSPQKIRYQLEDEIVKGGTQALGVSLVQCLNTIDRLEPRTREEGTHPSERSEMEFAYRRVHWAWDQYNAIKAYDEEYVGWFEAATWGVLEKTLATSAAGAAAARRQYGVPDASRQGSAEEQASQGKARAELVTVATEMSLAKASLEGAEYEYSSTLKWLYSRGGAEWASFWEQQAQWDLDHYTDPNNYTPESYPDAIYRVTTYSAMKAKRETARKQYSALFTQRAQRYPILGAYRDASSEDLKKLGTADNVIGEVAAKTYEIDRNIAKVRDHLHDHAYDVWKLDNVIHQTMASLHVAPGSLESRIVEEKIASAEPWWHSALIWIGVGLALAAAPFTAGSSIAIAIELAGLALTAVQLGVDVQGYRFGMAASHTDLDSLRAVASQEPSLLPIIMDLAFAGLQVASVVKAFRAAAKLERAVARGAETAETKALVEELNEVGQQALGRNLGDEIEREALRAAKAAPYEEELARVLEGTPGATLGVKVRPLDKDAFFAATHSESGQAAVVFKRNPATGKLEPELVVREGADPRVVREEAAHINQAADPSKAHLIEELDEAKLGNWSNLTHEQRMSSVHAKLELELDAQKQVLGDLRAKPVLTDAEALQLDNAWQNIENLRAQFEEWGALENAGKAGATDKAILDQPARLFSKPTTTEFDALAIAAKDNKEFIAKYRELHPSSRLTDAELAQRFEDGKRINPDSGFLHDPTRRASRKAEVEATFRKGSERQLTTGLSREGFAPMKLSPEAEAERTSLIAERDRARAEREALLGKTPPDETGAAKVGARVNEASRRIGELHANEYMAKFHADYNRIYPPHGTGSRTGDFDQVWRRFKMVNGREEYLDEIIIIEAKGGAGKLGVKNVKGQLVEQGTPAYYEAIVGNMQTIDADAYQALKDAGRSKTKYLLVHSPIESGAPSVADTILVDEFNIGGKK